MRGDVIRIWYVQDNRQLPPIQCSGTSKYTLEKGKVIRVERDTGVTGRLLIMCMHTHTLSHHLCIEGDA